MWSQAVFQSPMSGRYSMVTTELGLVAEDLSQDRSLVSTFEDLLAGSSSIRPSRLPKMLWPTQLMTLRLREANMGASTVFIKVSPVLPSLPAWSEPVDLGELVEGGDRGAQAGREVDVGVAALEARRARRARWRAEARARRRRGRRSGYPSGWWTSESANGGSVLATFRTIKWSIDSASDERGQVGGDAVDCLANRFDGGLAGPQSAELRDGRSGAEMRSRAGHA